MRINRDNLKASLLATIVLGLGICQARTQAPRPTHDGGLSHRASEGTTRSADPEGVGLSSERLERISHNIQKSIEEKRIAGAVALVARRGQIAYLKAFGLANQEDRS